MSSELTSELSLFKAVPGSGEPFRTSDLNDNSDKIDAAVVADRARLDVVEADIVEHGTLLGSLDAADGVLDGRLDAVEALNWVTTGRIAAGQVTAAKLASDAVETVKIKDLNVTAAKLANTLDLSAKSVVVATQAVGNTSSLAASSAFATYAAQDTVQGWVFEGANLPAKFASGSYTAVPSSGLLTVDLTSFGFDSGLSLPVVTANIYQPGTTKFVVGVQSVSYSTLVFKVLTSTGANATVSTRVDWQAVQARA